MTFCWPSFARVSAALCVASALLVPAANLLIDPFEVFGTSPLRAASTLNERFAKSRAVLAEPAYDVMLFGSSVAGVIDPGLLAGGGRAYNLSFFSATPGDILQMLRLLERHGRLPRVVYIGLDPFMFTRPVPGAPQMRLPPEASGQSAWAFWRDYAFAGSLTSMLAKTQEHFAGAPAVLFDLRNGTYRLPALDADIARDPVGYARRRVDLWPIPLRGSWWHAPAANDLARLVAWTHARPRLHVVWFLQPLHRRMRDALGADATTYFATVRSIVGPSLVDLSAHPVSRNSALWYECKHFRPEAASAVVAALWTKGRSAPRLS